MALSGIGASVAPSITIAATGTYSNPALSLPSDPYGLAWATAPTDGTSRQMQTNWDVHSQSGDLSAWLGGLGTLINFDPTVLSGVDLSVLELPQTSALQSLSFHADASGRSFAMQSHAGSVSASVDLSDPALWGSKDQRQAAVQSYLAQFDAANQRAHGGTTLLGQFGDAFSELNSSYPVSGAQYANAIAASQLNTKDRSVLTGLADFKASMSGTYDNGSTTQATTESGRLDYSVSQNTVTDGFSKNIGLTVVQTQAATLAATYDASRNKGPLDLSSGNFDLHRINDSSSTTTAFSYVDNLVKSAHITTLVNQSMLYEKLVNHEVVEKASTPYNLSTTQDISAQLRRPPRHGPRPVQSPLEYVPLPYL